MNFHEMLVGFLSQCRDTLKSKDLLLCMGSEACDIDSFVSALAIAIHEKAVFVVNMSRRILEAKGDLMCMLQHFRISLDDLVFLERPNGSFTTAARRLATTVCTSKSSYAIVDKTIRLILVDHHRPVPELRDCPIELIIDHHVPGGTSLAASRIYVDIALGSCATLVTKFIGHSLFHSKYNKCRILESKVFCKGIAEMLMVPISVDTKNFKKSTSHFDRGEFNKLKRLTGVSRKRINQLRKMISQARRNDDEMPTDIIMQKDYKGFEHNGYVFGIATVKYSFRKWVDRECKLNHGKGDKKAGKYLEFALNDFRREHGLDFVAINRKAGKRRAFGLLNFPFEGALVKENGFVRKEYKGFYYYEIPADMSRKIMVPKIKNLIDRMRLEGHNK